MGKIDKLADELDYYQSWLRMRRQQFEQEKSPKRRQQLADQIAYVERYVKRLEKQISELAYELENCDHSDYEDTGGPDGSQACLNCGKIR